MEEATAGGGSATPGHDFETLPQTSVVPSSFADLESYILHAEAGIGSSGEHTTRKNVFNRAPNGNTPRLRKDQVNRIIIYSGKFNPPHRGHRELLLHTYLSTDSKTIAAMILPGSTDGTKDQKYDLKKAVNLYLSRQHRDELWRDELMARWSWIFPGSRRNYKTFLNRLYTIARQDGYSIHFYLLAGPDHVTLTKEPNLQAWWAEGFFTSDISRPADFMLSYPLFANTPQQLPGYEPWQGSILRDLGAKYLGHCWNSPTQLLCWPCLKFKWTYPEFAAVKSIDDLTCLEGDARTVLRQWHAAPNQAWWCRHVVDKTLAIFLPSGRMYPTDPKRTLISSTMVRSVIQDYVNAKLFEYVNDKLLTLSRGVEPSYADKESRQEKIYESIKKLVPNYHRFLIMLDLEDFWQLDKALILYERPCSEEENGRSSSHACWLSDPVLPPV